MGPDNRWIWRRRGEYEETVFTENSKYAPISIHLWGAIRVGFKSSPMCFEENVNSDSYVNSVKGSGFVELADMTFRQRQWCLVFGARWE
jgi:hypothetical protein